MKHEPGFYQIVLPAIHMEKQLGWACTLGGAPFLRISKVGQTVLVRLMESQIGTSLPALWKIAQKRGNSCAGLNAK